MYFKENNNEKSNFSQSNSIISKNPLTMNNQVFQHLNNKYSNNEQIENIFLNYTFHFLYNFFTPKENENPFGFQYQKNYFNNLIVCDELDKLKGKIDLLITIDLKDDSFSNGITLKKSLDSILTNFSELNKYNILSENIIIFIFIEEIKIKENYFNFYQTEENNKEYIYVRLMQYSQYDIYIFNTKFKFDIINIIYDRKDKNLFILKLKNGIRFNNSNIIKSLIQYSLIKENKKNSLIIPLIEYESLNDQPQNFFTEFENFENFIYNIYDLNYFDFTFSVPQNNYITFFIINKKNIGKFNHFYSLIYFSDYINSHSLSIYIKKSGYNVIFANKIICYKNRNHISFSQMINKYIKKKSNDFLVLNDLTQIFSEIPFFKKLLILHRFFGLFFSLLYPAFSTLFIYCILSECFNSKNPSFFFSCINIFFIILFLITSLISKFEKSKNYEYIFKINELNAIYFYIYDFYYIFICFCSCITLYNIQHNKKDSNYKFNKVMCLCLIFINFFISIIPILFFIKSYYKKIIKSLKYLFIACPGYNGFFNILGIINSFKIPSNKALCLLLICIFNSIIFIFGFFLVNRKRRIIFIEILSITFTIYNGLKILCIVINIVINNNKRIIGEKMENEKNIDKYNEEEKRKNANISNNEANNNTIKFESQQNDNKIYSFNKNDNSIPQLRKEDISIKFENNEYI